jgi:hypothetical protein
MFRRRPPDDGSDELTEGDAEVEVVEDDLPPSAMRDTEPMYGYLVAAELAVVGVLNLVVVHGAGAPKHPSRLLEIVGLLGVVGLVGLLRTRNRFAVGTGSMVCSLLLLLPRAPNSLVAVHFVAFLIAAVYGYTLTRRQTKAKQAETKSARPSSRGGDRGAGRGAGRGAPAAKSRPLTAAERRAETLARQQERRAKRRGLVTPTGPQKSRRYTPPKPRRARPPS